MRLRQFTFVAVSGTLAACTVGPQYAGPQPASAVAPPNFVRAADDSVRSAPALAHWWEALGDPVLDGLVTRALKSNPDVAVVEARLRQARATVRIERVKSLPTANAQALYAHAHVPGLDLGNDDSGGGSTDLDIFNVGFDASWEIDLFGGQRRNVEAVRAAAQAAEANVADAQVSLSAEVAQAYVNYRDRQVRIALNDRSVRMQEQMLALTRQRFDRGTVSRYDIVRLTGQLDTTRAETTPLTAQLDAYADELATLVGEAPGAVDRELAAAMPAPLPPGVVTIGDPAALLQRRPDIRAAERTLAANTARIGVAEAQRFPRLSFMGIIGLGGTSLSDLTRLDDFTALVAPQLSWSFLDFGRNKARVVQAEAVRDEAEAQYRVVVLRALRDAEDSLSRFRTRRTTVASRARAQASADEAVGLATQRYAAGTSTLIDLLDTQRQQIAAQQNLAAEKAALTGDFIAIQKALGLGWS